MNTKTEVRRQLLGSMIAGRCEQEPGILFQSNHCSGSKCIRFATRTTEELVPDAKSKTGAWKTSRLLQYEIYNDGTTLLFQLSLSGTGFSRAQKSRMENLLRAANAPGTANDQDVIAVRQWKYVTGTDVLNVQYVLNEIFKYELPFFEMELRCWQKDENHFIRAFPKLNEAYEWTEGEELSIQTSRFERNAEVRKMCIAHYGAMCRICGFDFGKTYGPACAGKIEVHHIVPLSEIRKEYVIDPVRDLIPVCANCHIALHSKPDGVYTPDELKSMIHSSE